MIHKKIYNTHANSILNTTQWRMCDERREIVLNWRDKSFKKWAQTHKWRWKDVTCPKCLALKTKAQL